MLIYHKTQCECGKKLVLEPDLKYWGQEFSVDCACGKKIKFQYWQK